MNLITHCITSDGAFMALAIDSSDLVFTAQKLHHLTKTSAAAFGRLLTAASMMGISLKQNGATITVKINGGGEIGNMLVKANSRGNVKGYVDRPDIDYPIREDGKIDVGKAVGNQGRMAVIRDYGVGEPYIGQVELVSGEIAEDITSYYALSEQIPTVCMLGVLTEKETGNVLLSGGILLQALPGADDASLAKIEDNIAALPPVTVMLAQGITPLEMCKRVLDGFEVEVLDEQEVNYACNCSLEKATALLSTVGKEELPNLPLVKDGKAEIVCSYCDKRYYFSKSELIRIAEKIS